mmetsp:Transcript_33379/g.77000  ORF Transcript_33379/g.77000 Transcript_33379/m.77000 type:complete len:115 (-) Transcript_33379:604-948(-)
MCNAFTMPETWGSPVTVQPSAARYDEFMFDHACSSPSARSAGAADGKGDGLACEDGLGRDLTCIVGAVCNGWEGGVMADVTAGRAKEALVLSGMHSSPSQVGKSCGAHSLHWRL